MRKRSQNKLHYLLIILIGLIALFCITFNDAPATLAQGIKTPRPAGALPDTIYFTSKTITLADGTRLGEYIINGPSHPPEGTALETRPVPLPKTNRAMGIVTLDVPAYEWTFGCSATSGAMIAAYYDRNGFPDMYTGPTGEGVMPMKSDSWPSWTDAHGKNYAQVPLAASHNGLDGRVTRGSIDDYWEQYNSSLSDPYLRFGWAQHAWGDAIGDYMKTSQSAFGIVDGATKFYYNPKYPNKLTCDAIVSSGIDDDGTVGRKQFYEARGYKVIDCYNQNTDNNGGGFTYAMYKAEIDAGRPVMLNLQGHTIVGVGYDSSSNTIYIHDTWDFNTWTMAWGGSYQNMALLSVSIVNLDTTCAAPSLPNLIAPGNGATITNNSPSFDWSDSIHASRYDFLLDDNADFSSPIVSDTNATSSAYILTSTLGEGTYYWKVRGHNTNGKCDVYGNWTAPWSFTISKYPGSFSKSSPANGSSGVSLSPTLSWGNSSGATGYQYCYDSSNDGACTNWVSVGLTTTVKLNNLDLNSTYYWQVKANNTYSATFADGSGNDFWSFTTVSGTPGAFNKNFPFNLATGISTNPTLSWGASNGATGYEYCIDRTNDDACDGSWVSTLNQTKASLVDLDTKTTYYWQARAINSAGSTYADSNWFSFTTLTSKVYLPAVRN